MIQEVSVRQGINRYELGLLIYIFLIWMTLQDAGLPYPVQAVQDPQEEMGEYQQRVVSGHMC